jgi:hypothetical protein
MTKRPSLADLATKKPTQEQRAEPAPERATEDAPRRGAQPDGRKGILIRVAPEGWRQLRDLAAELTLDTGQQVTMQSLITDAINDLLKQHKRPPVA